MCIWAWFIGLAVIGATYFHFLSIWEHNAKLDQIIQRWSTDYHLDESQARRIRTIEQEFHGTGDPILTPSHTAEEARDHHRGIAAVMSEEDGIRFLKMCEGRGKHEQLP